MLTTCQFSNKDIPSKFYAILHETTYGPHYNGKDVSMLFLTQLTLKNVE